ncbi:MAG: leucyl/phenylalanyl-tRNA--protein transferase [Treponemataceae bacterium]|nr:leucyl/phenylalanyl-tRNA--protein transferase [Spirochaetales bacterium]MDY6031760.1 leucyl/phenylalanyl-tRNA--protein transferase [Treponemataceae bacterium]
MNSTRNRHPYDLGNLPYLTDEQFIEFPDPTLFKNGIICYNGNLSPGILLSAYIQGIFAWYNPGDPIIWWSPDPRFVLLKDDFHVSKSTRKEIKRNERMNEDGNTAAITFTKDRDFKSVIEACASVERKDQNGTWITQEMQEAFCELNRLGYAHSYEAWQNDELAGGFYGVRLGNCFFGESIFTKVSNATKMAFVKFAENFWMEGGKFIDSQVYTDNIARYGAKNISRTAYLRLLKDTLLSCN